MALGGFAVSGLPFALWPGTLQVMPQGIPDAGFGRFFIGVRVVNSSAQAWPATEVRISQRGRRILAAARIVVSDGWSAGDGAAVAQIAPGEWIAMPALAAGAIQAVFLKLDLSNATAGLHLLELELRDPTAPATTLKASASFPVARTTCHGTQRTFSSVCDQGTLTASVSAVTMDQELFRRVLGKARALSGVSTPGTRTPAETERLRLRLRALLCGEESDVCAVLADLNAAASARFLPPPYAVLAAAAAAARGVEGCRRFARPNGFDHSRE